MSEQGHYEVTVHAFGWKEPLRRTFPFGQWAEVGFWLDEIAPGEGDSVAVTFHPLAPFACQVDESAGMAELYPPFSGEAESAYQARLATLTRQKRERQELHSVHHEHHLPRVGEVDMAAVERLERFTTEED